MPEDEFAETVELPGGRKVRSSFRYFPAGTTIEDFGRDVDAIFIEIRAASYVRSVLDSDGNPAEIRGTDARRPVGEFGS